MPDDDFRLPPKPPPPTTVSMTLRLPQDLADALEHIVKNSPGYNRHEIILHFLRVAVADVKPPL